MISRDITIVVAALILAALPWLLLKNYFRLNPVASCVVLFGVFLVCLGVAAAGDHMLMWWNFYEWPGYAGATKVAE